MYKNKTFASTKAYVLSCKYLWVEKMDWDSLPDPIKVMETSPKMCSAPFFKNSSKDLKYVQVLRRISRDFKGFEVLQRILKDCNGIRRVLIISEGLQNN